MAVARQAVDALELVAERPRTRQAPGDVGQRQPRPRNTGRHRREQRRQSRTMHRHEQRRQASV
ncbi:MAG TPA: hypothetical protein DIW77_02620 [Chromatiaceae bacterium]|jgi:hypothetical protein|nr:MAG: hypothetical protein N838_27130 [Thiohalocapsa sp. PB-PSB1]HCS88970.1 hypothetical protein [Chromatiaceae bacterium]